MKVLPGEYSVTVPVPIVESVVVVVETTLSFAKATVERAARATLSMVLFMDLVCLLAVGDVSRPASWCGLRPRVVRSLFHAEVGFQGAAAVGLRREGLEAAALEVEVHGLGLAGREAEHEFLVDAFALDFE